MSADSKSSIRYFIERFYARLIDEPKDCVQFYYNDATLKYSIHGKNTAYDSKDGFSNRIVDVFATFPAGSKFRISYFSYSPYKETQLHILVIGSIIVPGFESSPFTQSFVCQKSHSNHRLFIISDLFHTAVSSSEIIDQQPVVNHSQQITAENTSKQTENKSSRSFTQSEEPETTHPGAQSNLSTTPDATSGSGGVVPVQSKRAAQHSNQGSAKSGSSSATTSTKSKTTPKKTQSGEKNAPKSKSTGALASEKHGARSPKTKGRPYRAPKNKDNESLNYSSTPISGQMNGEVKSSSQDSENVGSDGNQSTNKRKNTSRTSSRGGRRTDSNKTGSVRGGKTKQTKGKTTFQDPISNAVYVGSLEWGLNSVDTEKEIIKTFSQFGIVKQVAKRSNAAVVYFQDDSSAAQALNKNKKLTNSKISKRSLPISTAYAQYTTAKFEGNRSKFDAGASVNNPGSKPRNKRTTTTTTNVTSSPSSVIKTTSATVE